MTKLFVPALLNLFLLPTLVMANDLSRHEIHQKGFDFPECPGTPNCVSSLAEDPAKKVEPFPLRESSSRSMELLADIIYSMPRATIVSTTTGRIEAEFRSLLGFVDDVLFVVGPDNDVIHVRSAAQSGTWDLGVNRRRVERIRRKYLESR